MNHSSILTRTEVREYDARAIAAGIPGIVLMENAARGATELLLSLGANGPISIVCGKGNNGGDGFAMARHLAAVGKGVSVELVADPAELAGDAKIAFQPLNAIGIPVHRISSIDELSQRLARAEWIVDALLGTGTTGTIRSPYDAVIVAINAAGRKVLAVDLPSGLDADTGEPLGPTIRANATATFVARKWGFDNPKAEKHTGSVYVLPIGASDVFLPTWPFDDSPNVAVFTTKYVVRDSEWIAAVYHVEEDGAWQFHSKREGSPRVEEAMIVRLCEITEIDNSVMMLADLPLGWCAWRDSPDSEWQRRPCS